MNKDLLKYLIIFALVFVAGSLNAQEMEAEVMIEAEVEVETTEETSTEDEVMFEGEGSMEMEEELSEEEVTEILEEAEEIADEEINEAEDLEGEVVLVTEEFVVIETVSGETIKVSAQTYNKNRPGVHRRNVSMGDVVTTGSVMQTGNGYTVTTKQGTYPVSSLVKVTKNGQEVSSEELEEGDEIVAILDEEGNLVALEVTEEGRSLVLIIIGIVVLLGAGYLALKKKPESPEMA